MLPSSIPNQRHEYDVVICGGGLAAQTLARQLTLQMPGLSILMIVKTTFPLPVAACKVGESTVEIAGFYFADTLRLDNYFKNNQFTKLGLRYFFGDSQGSFSTRPELGLSKFSPYDSFQIDRGVFENDLYTMNKRAGVTIVEDASVQEILIREDSANLHEVQYKCIRDNAMHIVQARWVIDAMGRRCFLQRKFGLKIEIDNNCSAVWFRVTGRFDLEKFVPECESQWHSRVPDFIRYYSTNHLMGRGYWVWLIPLASGNTSIGIVTSERIHPIATYNTFEKAMAWLQKFEPVVYHHLQDATFLDFALMKNYAYTSRQVFSEKRWACVGEAALFPDPFYSPGSNLIGFENTMVTRMIALDRENQLTSQHVEHYNNFAIAHNEWLIDSIHSSYPYFGNDQVMSLSYLWDLVSGWALVAPQMFNSIYLDPDKYAAVRTITFAFTATTTRLKQIFQTWETCAAGSFSFQFIDYLSVPFIREIYDRNLKKDKTITELLEDQAKNMEILEEFAQVIFLLAVEDVFPEKLPLFINYRSINVTTMSLDPESWDPGGLFDPTTSKDKPRHGIREQIRSLYTFKRTAPNIEKKITVQRLISQED